MTSIVDPRKHHSEDSAPDSGSKDEGGHSTGNPSSDGHPDSRSLIPERRTLHLGLTADPVQALRTVMMRTSLVTCSANLSKENQNRRHSPTAIADHGNQSHTSEP